MRWLLNLLTFPVSAPIRGSLWAMERVVEEADRQLYDEDLIRGQLAELELRHEVGELSEEQLEQAEDVLLERLRVARARREGA